MTAPPSTEDLARLADAITPAPQPEAATPTAQEAVAVMRQWPDPLTSDMARALEQHRGIVLVEIMSMFDQMQRQLDYSRGGKLGPVDPPQPSASVVEAIAACETVLICAQEMCKAGHPVSAFNVATDALRALKGDDANG